MEFSNAPFYIIAGIDKDVITFKRDNKTITRPHRDIDHKRTDVYLLTRNGFVTFSSKNSNLYKKVHITTNDIATHLYTYNDEVICIENDKLYEKLDYDEIKGNWFIKNMDNYKIIRHLGCCHKCSDNHEILVNVTNIKCYNDKYIYISGITDKYIEYANRTLYVHNYVKPKFDWFKFSQLKTIKIVSVNEYKVRTNKGKYDLKSFDKIDFNSEYLETVDGLASITNSGLTFKGKQIRVTDITYVTVIDDKISHIHTKFHNLCCKTGNLDVTSHKTVNNEHFPWTLSIGETYRNVWHIMQCSHCAGSSSVKLDIQNIVGCSDIQIIFNHITAYKVKKSKLTLINTHNGLDIMLNDYDEPVTTNDSKTTETPETVETAKTQENTENQQKLPPSVVKDSTDRIWHVVSGTIATPTGPAMGHHTVFDSTKTVMEPATDPTAKTHEAINTPVEPEDNKEKARKAIEIVEKTDFDETSKRKIIKSIEEMYNCLSDD